MEIEKTTTETEAVTREEQHPWRVSGMRLSLAEVAPPADGSRAKQQLAPNKEPYDHKFIASTERLASDGGVILLAAWNLTEYMKRPRFITNHDIAGQSGHRLPELAVGRVVYAAIEDGFSEAQVGRGGRALVCYVRYMTTAFAQEIKTLYEEGGLDDVSVRWDGRTEKRRQPTQREIEYYGEDLRWVCYYAEMIELSAVLLGADPGAQRIRSARLAEAMERCKSRGVSLPNVERLVAGMRAATAAEEAGELPEAVETSWEPAAEADGEQGGERMDLCEACLADRPDDCICGTDGREYHVGLLRPGKKAKAHYRPKSRPTPKITIDGVSQEAQASTPAEPTDAVDGAASDSAPSSGAESEATGAEPRARGARGFDAAAMADAVAALQETAEALDVWIDGGQVLRQRMADHMAAISNLIAVGEDATSVVPPAKEEADDDDDDADDEERTMDPEQLEVDGQRAGDNTPEPTKTEVTVPNLTEGTAASTGQASNTPEPGKTETGIPNVADGTAASAGEANVPGADTETKVGEWVGGTTGGPSDGDSASQDGTAVDGQEKCGTCGFLKGGTGTEVCICDGTGSGVATNAPVPQLGAETGQDGNVDLPGEPSNGSDPVTGRADEGVVEVEAERAGAKECPECGEEMQQDEDRNWVCPRCAHGRAKTEVAGDSSPAPLGGTCAKCGRPATVGEAGTLVCQKCGRPAESCDCLGVGTETSEDQPRADAQPEGANEVALTFEQQMLAVLNDIRTAMQDLRDEMRGQRATLIEGVALSTDHSEDAPEGSRASHGPETEPETAKAEAEAVDAASVTEPAGADDASRADSPAEAPAESEQTEPADIQEETARTDEVEPLFLLFDEAEEILTERATATEGETESLLDLSALMAEARVRRGAAGDQ